MPPVYTNDQIIAQLDSGYSWTGTTVTYGFPTVAEAWSLGGVGDEGYGFHAFDTLAAGSTYTGATSQETNAIEAMELWDDLIAIDFDFSADGDNANVQFANTTTDINYAHAYYPTGSDWSGTIWLNSEGYHDLYDPNPGSYEFLTLLHEIGHAIGLNHPGAYTADPLTYATGAEYEQDTHQYTVMSYFDSSNTGAQWYGSDGIWKYPQTPMVHDILAIQDIYGADTTTRTGDTVYGFNANAGKDIYDFSINIDPVLTIYDAGGNDTLDFSGFTLDATINLAPGSYSSGGGFSAAFPMISNIGIAYGTWIENAIGGSGNDTITGNIGNNYLIGGLGADALDGLDGFDVASYRTATSGVVADLANSANNTGEAAGDTYANIEALEGSSHADTLTGNNQNNYLTGGGGGDTLNGGGGFDHADYRAALAAITVNLANMAANTGDAAGDTYNSIEVVDGSSFDDTITGDGNDNVLLGWGGNDVISGAGGNDRLHGGDGGDTLNGGTGNDDLRGDAGDDTLNGDDGNDYLMGGAGADALNGGNGTDHADYRDAAGGLTIDLSNTANNTGDAAGDTYNSIEVIDGSNFADTIIGDGNDNVLLGWGGNDVISGAGGNDRLHGGDGGDTLNGGTGNDDLRGDAGNDTLNGDDGNDYLMGGAGADALNGGNGTDHADYRSSSSGLTVDLSNTANNTGDAAGDTYNSIEVIDGSNYADTLTGDGTDNVLLGWGGIDQISGGGGNDRLHGGDGGDTLNGGAGNDDLRGDAGDDTLTGGGDNDILRGGIGNDILNGDDGNDYLRGGAGGDTLNGGNGTDHADYRSSSSRLTVDLSNTANNTGDAAGDTYNSIEVIDGSNYADTLTGDGTDNVLLGWGGNDVISGAGGNDRLHGGDGGDTLNGGTGNDDLRGDAGDDTLNGDDGNDYLMGGAGADALNGGNGTDHADYRDAAGGLTIDLSNTANNTGDAAGDTYNSIEVIDGSNFADTIIGDGNDNVLLGWGGNDVISGAGGNDRLHGGDGGDTLNGGTGNDDLRGDAGNDTLNGDDGNDYLMGGAGADALNGGNGTDHADYRSSSSGLTVDLSNTANNTGDAAGDTYNSIEVIDGSNFADTISGSALGDVLLGWAGDDIISADIGDDQVFGGDGADTLSGGTGNDDLRGDAGADNLNGNAGNDLLTGGLGNDTFVKSNDGSVDTITDFSEGFDQIDISDFGYSSANDLLGSQSVSDGNLFVALDADDTIVLEGIGSTYADLSGIFIV